VATRFYGYAGRILNVDLSSGEIRADDLDEQVARKFLGGRGLAVKMLYDEIGPGVDPMSPENIVIVTAGPLTGTASPTNSRAEVITKSPLTGILGIGNFGGPWGPRLKLSGYDAVVVRSVSDSPVYLWIDNGKAELRSAHHLWGKGMDTWEVTDTLRHELGDDVSVLTIGPAGERLVKFACPIVDCVHAPGRTAAGCVMGVKKLKAIAVRGSRAVPIAHPQKFKEAVQDVLDRIAAYPERGFRPAIGSNEMLRDAAETGRLPVRNWQTGSVPPDNDFWGLPGTAAAHTRVGPEYGWHCPLAPVFGCDLVADIKTGKYEGLQIGGVAYSEPGWDGAKLEIRSFPAMWKLRELSNRYGLDEVLGYISFAMELYDRGILTKDDLGGLDLKWGDEDAVMELMRKVAYREGIGDVLAEGSTKAAKKIGKGAEKYAIALKGMDILYMDPRTWWPKEAACVLGALTCLRGGDDLTNTHIIPEGIQSWARKAGWNKKKYLDWFVNRIDMFEEVKGEVYGSPPRLESLEGTTTRGKAALCKWFGEITSLIDSLGICLFLTHKFALIGPTQFARLYSSCTGWDVTSRDIMKAGERIYNLMKAYIVREGWARQDDDWPERFYEEPIQEGPTKGAKLPREEMHQLLGEYYEKMGWDKETGLPTRNKLLELGLEDVADELASMDKLA